MKITSLVALWFLISCNTNNSDNALADKILTGNISPESIADSVIYLYAKGKQNILWYSLQKKGDVDVHSFIIHKLTINNIPLEPIIDRLTKTDNSKELSALIQVMSNKNFEQIPKKYFLTINRILKNIYKSNPDAEVHSSAEYFFRESNQDSLLNLLNINLLSQAKLQVNWFFNKEGFTMVLIKKPDNFVMGSPANETSHSDDEIQHLVSIPRSYAISNKEVSQSQFQEFLTENPTYKKKWTDEVAEHFKFRGIAQFISDPQNPQAAVSWYDAIAFCNWLCKKEGIPHQEWCYPDSIGQGMILPKNYLKRKGYRLPTEAEWEYAARAGTVTAHFFGKGNQFINEYAWYRGNTNSEKTRQVGLLKPNQYGLFDIYGNVWEWCQDRRLNYTQSNNLSNDLEDSILLVLDTIARTRRGGSFAYDIETLRSAHRGATNYFPNQRRDGVGFRIVQTID